MASTTSSTYNKGSLAKTITKILSFHRIASSCSGNDETHKIKRSKTIEEFPEPLNNDKVEDEKQIETTADKEAMESLLANLFASISAIKAAYAQLQLAQLPYDPDTIQSSDQAVISELKHLSELKQSYLKKQLLPYPPQPPIEAQIQENHNLIKTYKITTNKLEREIQSKASEIHSLQSQLIESSHKTRGLESQLHSGHMLSSLDELHISGLNPGHFLAALRYAVKSIKSFAKLMMHEMKSAEWDLNATALSIQPDVLIRSDQLIFAFESFICKIMFSAFQDRNFGLSSVEYMSSWEREDFFLEFTELKSAKPKQFFSTSKGISSEFGKFSRAKYLTLVHPKMEASFFGDLDQREIISSGRGFPSTDFFMTFAEMARRVWLMHCLFFSFGSEMDVSIFQVSRESRFSEVYMESVTDGDKCLNGARPVVGFTVVPGFRIGKTIIQCKVMMR